MMKAITIVTALAAVGSLVVVFLSYRKQAKVLDAAVKKLGISL